MDNKNDHSEENDIPALSEESEEEKIESESDNELHLKIAKNNE